MTNSFAFITREWQLLLFGFLMTFFSIPGQTVFISLFSGEIRNELMLTHGQFGAIYSFATLCSALLIVWTGALADRIPLAIMSIAVVLLLALACLLIAHSTSLAMLFISIFVLRHAGQGLMTLCGITALVRYIQQDKGKSTAIGNMGYTLAEASMPVTIVALFAVMDWRQTWLLIATVLSVIMLPAVTLLLRGHKQRHQQYQHKLVQNPVNRKQWKRSQVIRHPGFFLVVPAIMGHSLLYTGFIFHQVHLIEFKGWQLQQWAPLFIMYSLVSVASMLITGALVDRFSAHRLLPMAPVCMMLALITLFFADSIVLAAVALFFMGMSGGASAGVSSPFWVEAYGSKYLGSIKSLAYALVVLFSALSPVAIGTLLDLGVIIDYLLLAGACFSLVSLLLVMMSTRFFQQVET